MLQKISDGLRELATMALILLAFVLTYIFAICHQDENPIDPNAVWTLVSPPTIRDPLNPEFPGEPIKTYQVRMAASAN